MLLILSRVIFLRIFNKSIPNLLRELRNSLSLEDKSEGEDEEEEDEVERDLLVSDDLEITTCC